MATVDLSVAYFDKMRQWLDDLRLGKKGYAFVISPAGKFISHPNPKLQMQLNITEVPEFQGNAELEELTKRLLASEAGSMRAADPSTGTTSVFFFAPIRSAKWSFIVVTPE